MGNSFGIKKTAKVMNIDAETFKVKTPVRAEEVVKDYPGHVLLDSESVQHFGVRAKPLQPHQSLEPKRLYFLVEPPKEFPPRRVRSRIHMSAQERLENLMLARRSSSDLSLMKPAGGCMEEESGRSVRVKLRVPKAEMEKLVKGSNSEAEAAEKIVGLYMANLGAHGVTRRGEEEGVLFQQRQQCIDGGNGIVRVGLKTRKKRVSFKEAVSERAVAC